MTIRKFHRIVKEMNLHLSWYREIPLRPYFALFAKLPGLKEMFVKMCACVIEKKV
jgi:hypothetical protein